MSSAAAAEVLLTEQAGSLEAEGMDRTYKFTQKAIAENVDVQTSQKIFDLHLDQFGPYNVDFTRSGRHMLLGGSLGHLALIDTLRNKPMCEIQLRDRIRDVQFLHDHTMFAVAQKKYTYIYDNNGTELHCLRHHLEPMRLEFLPYHFLLVTAGRTGYVKWQDTSTGQLVAETRTKRGACDCLRRNPYNAVVALGHSSGVVSMYSPTMSSPLVKMATHKGSVTSLAIDLEGRYLVTTGADSQMKVWDLRTYRELHSYYTNAPATSVDVSQLGQIAVGFGSHVQVWKDALGTKAQSPYLRHGVPGSEVRGVRFKPFDDVLAVAHRNGLSNMVVPGSGEPNYDAFEANPYQTGKQRKETVAHALLEKLQPSMIQIDPNIIGEVDRAPEEVIARERRVAMEASKKPKKEKKKMRGRNKAGKKHKKKMQNIVMDEKAKARETKNRAAAAAVRAGKSARGAGGAGGAGAGKGKGKGKGKATVAPSAAAETGALGRFSRSQAKS